MRTALRQLCFQLAALAALATVSLAQTSLIEQGRAAIGRGDEDAAIEILEKAVAESPNSADAHYWLATAYGERAQRGGMLSVANYGHKAKGEFETAIALDPKHVESRFALVQIYAAAPAVLGGSFDKALEQARAIRAIDRLAGHRAYAVVYSRQKKLDLARQEFRSATREQPNSAKAHTYFGQYLSNVEKDYPAAFAELETAIKVGPGYMPAAYYYGRTAALADTNLARGEALLKKYLDYMPKANEPALARAHYYLGAVYEKEGKTAEAAQSYQAALELNPSQKDASEALKRVQ